MKSVLLEDHTVGQTETGDVGDKVEVTLWDENGMTITKTGVIIEVLDEDTLFCSH